MPYRIKTIRNTFNHAAETYDDYCVIQSAVCRDLITYLAAQQFSTGCIADFGCGTGVSTQCLIKHFPDNPVYALDIADKLVEKAKTKIAAPNAHFLIADFDNRNFSCNSLDLIFSNMALQWSRDIKKALSCMALQLKAKGIGALSLPVAGTFQEIPEEHRNNFYCLHDMLHFFDGLGFKCLFAKQEAYIDVFNSPIEAMRSIKKTGANFISIKNSPLSRKTISCQLTYQIGFFIVEKTYAD